MDSPSTPRRHDIDALRVLAFAAVMLYHLGMVYVGDWHWHLKSAHTAVWLQTPMRALNLWRLDLVFLVSGIALALLAQGRPRARLLRERSQRLLLPLAFGMVAIVPVQAYLQALDGGFIAPGFGAFLLRYATLGPWPPQAFDGAQPGVTWNHLWYLAYLWAYTALLVAALPWLRSGPGQRLQQAVRRLRGPALWLLPAVLPVLATLALRRAFPPTHDLLHDAWLHALYAWMVFMGWWLGTDPGLWAELQRLRRISLVLALALLVLLALTWHGLLPLPWAALRSLEQLYAWVAICAVLGWARQLLDRPWPWLPWAQEQLFPWYVLHQTLILLGLAWLAPMQLGPLAEPALLLALTVAGCWGATAVIRRVRWLRPLFGLKPPAPPRCPAPATPGHPGAHSA